MRNNFGLKLIISVFLTLGLSISFQSLLAQTWSSPTDNPPDGMVGTGFVTLTNIDQIKTGGLEILGGATTTDLNISDNLLVVGDITASHLNITGNAGFGTLAPLTNLHIDSNQSDGTWLLLTGGDMGFIAMQAYGDTPHNGVMYFDQRGDFVIASQPYNSRATGNGEADRLVIEGDTGNIGINKTNPSTRLDVNGNTSITGNLNVTGTIFGSFPAHSHTITYEDCRYAVPAWLSCETVPSSMCSVSGGKMYLSLTAPWVIRGADFPGTAVDAVYICKMVIN